MLSARVLAPTVVTHGRIHPPLKGLKGEGRGGLWPPWFTTPMRSIGYAAEGGPRVAGRILTRSRLPRMPGHDEAVLTAVRKNVTLHSAAAATPPCAFDQPAGA